MSEQLKNTLRKILRQVSRAKQDAKTPEDREALSTLRLIVANVLSGSLPNPPVGKVQDCAD